ncbi:unnamed protein product [Arctogadus glacialis]
MHAVFFRAKVEEGGDVSPDATVMYMDMVKRISWRSQRLGGPCKASVNSQLVVEPTRGSHSPPPGLSKAAPLQQSSTRGVPSTALACQEEDLCSALGLPTPQPSTSFYSGYFS